MSRFEVGGVRDEDEVEALVRILAVCFDAPAEVVRANLERLGHQQARVVRDGGRVVGGLELIPMGQWFGGRVVPMTGVAAVGIAPEARGRGAARALMQATVRELAADEVPLSTLYPATVPLYRSAGYELAGGRYELRLPLAGLGVRAAEPALREAGPDDEPAMVAAYGRFARSTQGLLERAPYIWERTRRPRGEATRHYVVEGDDGLGGYLSLLHVAREGGMYDLRLTDLVVLEAAAGRRLLTFLAGHASLCEAATFHAAPGHPLLLLQPEWRAKARLHLHWMTRILHAPAALAARGYPAGVNAELHLEIADDVVPENARRLVLELADGRTQVAEGGQGRLRLDVRAMAALYTGFQPPAVLQALGWLEGSEQELARAAAVFAGPAPWMPDIF